jgi:hypothetical protein
MLFTLPIITTFISLALCVSGSPISERATHKGNNTASDSQAASTPKAPHFVVYSDLFVSGGAPPAKQLAGYNV